ncbi:hypothetical protein COT94_01995 [Candidatus Falkowbacteria bacterium CG10_big_fil_rev_8_21_14_0_10_37_14]|uniref:Uncharacterized protein n=1 Tax=Candidatus Falkowbacteria bacterium CG10_big_fil_rev_8_21_14_0_10_37_14 TaxID=1974561 RepID=A0A2M6WTB2_9BACT|nr:hypothetical protein [Candidatus Falkowbacteria bacterium]PIT96015.1 MAG: hypothetical protein COT94_01995 [Candidatus Falkowbacteria bacterium CG10_big_fil_rev_8_21_14_0_10_37_14]
MITLKNKILFALFSLTLLSSLAMVMPKQAQAEENIDLWGDLFSKPDVALTAAQETGLGTKDPRVIVGGIIRTLLGFLGLLAVIFILVGGFKWMTSQGNQAKVDEAQKLMVAGVVGLLIVLAAFAISLFVTRVGIGVTGATPTTNIENTY